MTKQIIYILFISVFLKCNGQELTNERQISVGVYGIAYPTKYRSIVHAGVLLDLSIKDKKRLCSSSSINYSGYYRYSSQFHNISITSGLSWKLQKNHFCFRPGIQLGYLYLNDENTNVDYLFHGGFGRLSAELTYVMNRFEYGLQFNMGMGYGPTRYYYPNEIRVQNLFGLMGGFGLEVKYNLFK